MKLASQRRTRDRSGKDNNNSFESKKWVGCSKHSNKRGSKKYYVLIKKRHIKSEKYITPMDFAEQKILQNQTFQRTSKFIFVDSSEMDLMNGIVISVKVDEMYNITKSASHCLLVELWRCKWMIKGFAGVCPWMSIRLLRSFFIKLQASSCNRYSHRESLILQYRWLWSSLFLRTKKIKWKEKLTSKKLT